MFKFGVGALYLSLRMYWEGEIQYVNSSDHIKTIEGVRIKTRSSPFQMKLR